jgi:2-polyprenyl-3-methyl-5-hydroxy-6-metoxy-1,4-benzoquinol methylase
MIIDLGCGPNKHEGAIGLDNVKLDGVDIVHDLLDFPYPFQASNADQVIISHVLEHFVIEDIIRIINEAGRMLKKDGSLMISTPHAFSPAAFGDPSHKTFFMYGTMYVFTTTYPYSYRKSFKLDHDWKMTRMWTTVNVFNEYFLERPSLLNKVLSKVLSEILNHILRTSRSMTLPDLAAKYLPVWLVTIHAQLQKVSDER